MSSLMSFIEARVDDYARSWPRSLQRDFNRYLREQMAERGGGQKALGRLPHYWLLLPSWLFHRYNSAKRRPEVRTDFLSDVLWGQYCIYLLVRMQDDLLDGQAHSLSLQFAADQFFIESEQTFSQHFRKESSFWRIFREYFRLTTRAVMEVDRLERQPGKMTRSRLSAHAKVCSIFKLGAAAVCMKCRRKKHLPAICRFSDELAISGQILDDLEDLEDDLLRGRFSYVANVVLEVDRKRSRLRGDPMRRIVEGIFINDGMANVLKEVKRHLSRAREAIEPVGISPAERYVDDIAASLSDFEDRLHKTRVRLLLTERA
jgi:hypothetical protein